MVGGRVFDRGYRQLVLVRTHRWSGIDADGLEHLARWKDAIKERPACRRGVEVPFVMATSGDKKAEADFAKVARKIVQR